MRLKVGKNCAYLEAIEANILEQPAVKVWLQIDSNNTPPTRIETLRRWGSPKPYVCRMLGIETVDTPIIAKRCKKSGGLQEKLFYETILPGLGLPSLKYHGSCEDGDDYLWVFMEDVGGRRFSYDNPADRRAGVEWLTRLHTSSATDARPPKLIERGPAYYRDRLSTVCEIVSLNSDREVFPQAEKQIMTEALNLLAATAALWDSIVALYECVPHCIIHGDFKSKNIHIRAEPQATSTSVFVFDWEYAGWGMPGSDIWRLDEDEYLLAVTDHWPQIDIDTVRAMKNLGTIFRSIDSYFWEVRRFRHAIDESARRKLRQNLAVFNAQLTDALQTYDTGLEVRQRVAAS